MICEVPLLRTQMHAVQQCCTQCCSFVLCLVGAWWVPGGCLVGAWWVPGGCLVGAWWVPAAAVSGAQAAGQRRSQHQCHTHLAHSAVPPHPPGTEKSKAGTS
jgi:hypothetical protein